MILEPVSGVILGLAVRSTVIVLLAGALVKLCIRRSAPFRCGVLTAAMLVLALLPIISLWLPRMEVGFLPAWSGTPGSLPSSERVSPGLAASVTAGFWGAGVLVLALFQSAGLWQLQRWRARSVELNSGFWAALVQDAAVTLGYRGRIRLYLCPGVPSPAASGLIRPCVFLPKEALEWDTERLRIVLLHEVGHLKRGDLWTQWLSRWVCTLYWFHPLVWKLGRTLHQTRELACDHTVLSSGTKPACYATHLVALARILGPQRRGPLALHGLCLAMATPATRPSSLETRVRAILSFHSSRRRSLLLGFSLTLAGLAAVWATATVTPASRPLALADEIRAGHSDAAVPPSWTPAEIHLRLTADPFPGR